ncbi:MAG: hypothetical protein GC159_12830 [Phycisphaera sp.]|nr:hypothetical protein [Phycisphaera sp.]
MRSTISGKYTARVWLGAVAIAVTVGAASPKARAGGDLRDVIKDLYGGDGIRLAVSAGGHDAHFTDEAADALSGLSEAVSSNIGGTSTSSAVVGFILDLETGLPVRTTGSLGPIFAESATTVGKGNINIGMTYSRIEYKYFEGNKLDDLSFRLKHPDVAGNGGFGVPDGMLAPFQPFGPMGPTFDFELDEILVDIDLELDQDVAELFAEYGINDQWDVGVILPIVHTHAEAHATASIIDNSPINDVHNFHEPPGPDPDGGPDFDARTSQTGGDATGIGDIALRTKYNFLRGDEDLPDFAVAGQIILPTGDESNLLGTGHTRLQVVAILAKAFGNFKPHLNLGYELVADETSLSNIRYAVGTEYSIHERVTLSADILGRWEHSGDGVGDSPVDVGFGAKVNIFETTHLKAGVAFPLNHDDGLRPGKTFVFGIEHLIQ